MLMLAEATWRAPMPMVDAVMALLVDKKVPRATMLTRIVKLPDDAMRVLRAHPKLRPDELPDEIEERR